MTFEIYLKKDIGNQIREFVPNVEKIISVDSLEINNGLLKKGSYYIPIEHILFIKEVA